MGGKSGKVEVELGLDERGKGDASDSAAHIENHCLGLQIDMMFPAKSLSNG